MDTASNKSRIVAGMAVAAASLAAHGETITFDTDPPGVWTKADSVTSFDDFSYGPPTP